MTFLKSPLCFLLAGCVPCFAGILLQGEPIFEIRDSQLSVDLNWTPVPGSTSYMVSIDAKNKSQRPTQTQEVKSNRAIFHGISEDETYTWRVQPIGRVENVAGKPLEGGTFLSPTASSLTGRLDVPYGVLALSGTDAAPQGSAVPPAKASLVGSMIGSSSFAPVGTPKAEIVWNEEALQVRFTMMKPNNRELLSKITQRDGPVWTDDEVEVFIQPPEDRYYYQFGANLIGTQYDAKNTDGSWNGEWKSEAKMEGNTLVYLISIPWKTLQMVPTPGKEFKGNITATFGPEHLTKTWANMMIPHDPEKFNKLMLLPK
jgi:hypothetical protein